MTTRTYDVPGISCGHCKSAIEAEVWKVPGVTAAEVEIEARTLTVTGDATDEQLRAAVSEAGYEVDGPTRS